MGSTGFTDVDGRPEWSWAAPAIKWAVDEGIIHGRGDGTYAPGDDVTSIEFAILCLKMLGYGENGEYEGSSWDSNGLFDGMRYGILTIDNVNFRLAATREQVAFYAFMALTSNMVEWNAFLNMYVDGSRPLFGFQGPGAITLGEITFNLTATLNNGPYGINGRMWTVNYGRTHFTGYYQTAEILSKTTNGRNIDNMTTLGHPHFVSMFHGWTGPPPAAGGPAPFTPWTSATVPVFINGIQTNTGAAGSIQDENNVQARRLAAMSGNTVYLLSNNIQGRVDRVVIIAKTAQEALGTPIVAASGNITIPGVTVGTLNYTAIASVAPNMPYSSNTSIDAVLPTQNLPAGVNNNLHVAVSNVQPHMVEYDADIQAGDWLLIHSKIVGGVRVAVVEKAATVEGQMTSARPTDPTTITFGGTVYARSMLRNPSTFLHDFALIEGNFFRDATIWLDDNGDIVGARVVTPPAPVYGLVVSYHHNNNPIHPAASVRLLTPDGVTGVYEVAPIPGGEIPNWNYRFAETATGSGIIAPAGTPRGAVIVTYNFTDDGRVVLIDAGLHSTLSQPYVHTVTPRHVWINNRGGPGFTQPGRREIVASTVVFYYDWSRVWHATNNPAYVGPANWSPEGGIASTSSILFAEAQNVSNLAALLFTVRHPQVTPEQIAFVANPWYVNVAPIDGVLTYEYTVFVGGSPRSVFSTRNNLFAAGAGLWSYYLQAGTDIVTLTHPIALTSNAANLSGAAGISNEPNIISALTASELTFGASLATGTRTSFGVSGSTLYYEFTANPGRGNNTLVQQSASRISPTNDTGIYYRLIGREVTAGATTAVYFWVETASGINPRRIEWSTAQVATFNSLNSHLNIANALASNTSLAASTAAITGALEVVVTNVDLIPTAKSLQATDPHTFIEIVYAVNGDVVPHTWGANAGELPEGARVLITIRLFHEAGPWPPVATPPSPSYLLALEFEIETTIVAVPLP
jgi:hypothetical protein